MQHQLKFLAGTIAFAAATAAATPAQVTPSATPATTGSPMPAATAPAEPSAMPSDSPSAAPSGAPAASPTPSIEGHVRTLRKGTLTPAQLAYAVSHPAAEVAKLRAMRTVHFDNLRVYRVAPGILPKLHVSNQELAYEPFTASDGQEVALNLTQPLLNIIANINVQDALNNALNGNTVNVSLQNVLNNNKIAIGQLVGVYVGGGGIITTIIH